MKTRLNHFYQSVIGVMLLALLSVSGVFVCNAQESDTYHYQPVSLFGPRMGVTFLGGEVADRLRDKYDAVPIVTQFGWQFEWRFFSVDDGPTGVVEIIPLVGGLEQGLFLPNLSVPMGIRTASGFEMGIGPNVSITGFSIVIAVGQTFKAGQLYLPVNLAFVPSNKGPRFSLVFGFNTGG